MTLALQPIGAVAEPAVEIASQCVSEVYGFEVRVREPLPEPDYAWDSGRRQHNSFQVMLNLARNGGGDAWRVLGITERDLFIPALTFVFGQAQLDGPVSVVSTARLRQTFYGMENDDAVFRIRLRKEVLHEVGHTLGLTHCSTPFCTMRLSTGILGVDVKEDRLCDTCLRAAQRRLDRRRQEGL